ncbi:MAG: CPBP family intramembrane metalloprotease [Candidatus Obscuribacterales bacterium]|nr:CPBP family intramembrane metalloprotease [Candidatus Obscuribacterales bacterium]
MGHLHKFARYLTLRTQKFRRYFTILGSSDDQLQANWLAWIIQALVIALFVAVLHLFFPHPYSFMELWQTKGTLPQWLLDSKPILYWALGFTLFVAATTKNTWRENHNAEEFLQRGLWVSLRAGVMEEIVFRWLIFMASIILAQIFDFILGGFLFERGLLRFANEEFLLPLADYVTNGLLHNVLSNKDTWYIATAVLLANAKFRDGHKYQGFFGLVNSWFIGMYMFYLLFTYGLLACIAVHFTYDAIIFLIRYIDRVIERRKSRR